MNGIPCIWMRGGTSKGAYFNAADLPSDVAERDALLLAIMGSPDPRQIDGIGGGEPLCSKVAILSKSERVDADIDYLFLQVFVDQPLVSDAQACGNILAGVGPASIEMGFVAGQDGETPVRIHMVNTGEVATAIVKTPDGKVTYAGDKRIDGVPGQHAPVRLLFSALEGSMCGALLPSGVAMDSINGIDCTLIDYGMPLVLMRASDLGVTGQETPQELENRQELRDRIEAIRIIAGPMMGLGDVSDKSVPKMTLLSVATAGGVIATRSFIPHRCHSSIGVFAAISVARACAMDGSVAAPLAALPAGNIYAIEHPTGSAEVLIERNGAGEIVGAGSVRTARKLFEGRVFPRD